VGDRRSGGRIWGGGAKVRLSRSWKTRNLAVRIRGPAPMPMVGMGRAAVDLFRGFAGNAFEDDGACGRHGRGQERQLELLDGFRSAGLDTVSAHAVDALRGEAEMADDGDFGVGEGAKPVRRAGLDFDGFGTGFLDEADGVGEALGNGGVIAAEGACRRRPRARWTARRTARVWLEHFRRRCGEGVVVAETTMARESPTRSRSMPASSTRRALE